MSISQLKRVFSPVLLAVSLLLPNYVLAQASYTAQIRGTVTDQTGAIIQNMQKTTSGQ